MVGLVLVSHSRALANALLELTRQVASPDVPIAIAAGVGDHRVEFGTDAIEIHEAIQSIYTPDGVLVLMDLGSAILSAEMALELLPEDMRPNIRFCPAPLVEGTIAAAVQAGLGSSLETVYNEARQALLPKQDHLGDTSLQSPISEITNTGREVTLTLHTEHGLHARPAAQFVQTAGRFDAQITVRNQTTGKGPVSAKSLNALATLGALYGHEITIMADGTQASAALDVLTRLVQNNFGEHRPTSTGGESAPAREPQPARGIAPPFENEAIPAVAISEGIAIGPLARLVSPPPTVPDHPVDDPVTAWARLETTLAHVQQEIRTRRHAVAIQAGEEQAAIFDAHALIVSDPDLLAQVKGRIFSGGMNEAQAWHETIQESQMTYLTLDDPYLRQRATDVADVGVQVLRALLGETAEPLICPIPAILVSEDLTPTQTTQLDVAYVLGLMTVLGGPTSHSAILARSLGIPAVSGVPESMMSVPEGTLVGMDGGMGLLWIMPSEAVQADLETRRDLWLKQRGEWQKSSQQPALTTDGRLIDVVANVGNLADARAAVENGAEGIGLLRTEFLFLSRTTAPDEAEQFEALREILGVLGNSPVIVRTMDVGGDKPLAYISLPVEANPFLGVRGLRLSLQRPDLFTTQLRAILRAGAGHFVRIMFPMVSNLDEVLRARQMLTDVHTALDAEGIPHAWPIETGIMIEVPSAALLAPILAPHVDFFSVGTNDLTQYTLAAERGNPNLPGFADALHPAVLRLISQVVEAAEAHGKWVGVCGELAGDAVAAPVLVGLGVKELSLNPAGIPRIKSVVRNMTFADVKVFAQDVILTENALTARKLAENFLV
jgi:multiphosphoryl transfer protein